jgi:hypothetical protein
MMITIMLMTISIMYLYDNHVDGGYGGDKVGVKMRSASGNLMFCKNRSIRLSKPHALPMLPCLTRVALKHETPLAYVELHVSAYSHL